MAGRDATRSTLPRVFLGLLGAALIVVFFAGAGLGMGLTGAPTAVSVLLAGVLLLLAAALWKRFPPFMQAFGAVLAWIVAAFLVIETGALITIWQTGDESAETEDTGRFRTSWEPYLGMRTVPAGGWTIAPGVPAMRTVPRAAPDSVSAFEVWLLGGDMAWGGPMDDDSTLAAALQRKLDEHTGRPVRVVCAAQPQYVTTQELLQLALGLRDGGRPDLVVCLHGYDDIISAHTLSVAGDPMAMSRMRGESETGMSAAEALSAYTGAGRLLGQLLAGDEDTGPPAPREGSMPPKIMARRITRTAMVNQELIEALCRTRGARAAFFWQPTLWTAGRQLTDAEQGLRQTASVRPDQLGELVREVYSRVDSVSASLSRTWVLQDALTGEGEMFAGPSTLTGRGSERLAAEMVETLERAGLI